MNSSILVSSTLCRQLVSNNAKQRKQALKRVQSFLKKYPEMPRRNMLFLWKALFFSMWSADKHEVQQELAVKLSMLRRYISINSQIQWISAFYEILEQEWFRLDKHRLNKFLLFLRIFQAEIFHFLVQNQWNKEILHALNACLMEMGPLREIDRSSSIGISLQFMDTFLTELRSTLLYMKESTSKPSTDQMLLLLEPFFRIALNSKEILRVERLHQKIFQQLTADDINLDEVIQAFRSRLEFTEKPYPNVNLKHVYTTLSILENKSKTSAESSFFKSSNVSSVSPSLFSHQTKTPIKKVYKKLIPSSPLKEKNNTNGTNTPSGCNHALSLLSLETPATHAFLQPVVDVPTAMQTSLPPPPLAEKAKKENCPPLACFGNTANSPLETNRRLEEKRKTFLQTALSSFKNQKRIKNISQNEETLASLSALLPLTPKKTSPWSLPLKSRETVVPKTKTKMKKISDPKKMKRIVSFNLLKNEIKPFNHLLPPTAIKRSKSATPFNAEFPTESQLKSAIKL